MFKSKAATFFTITAALAASAATFAIAPASQNASAPVASTIEAQHSTAPSACDGQVWPYHTSTCVEAIALENGLPMRRIRVISIYKQPHSLKAQAYAALASEIRPSD